ncbi:MAG: NTP transferase domain-containing protein [Myxococcota bacterium]
MIPAIVTAGDGSAAKAVHGQNKVFLELGGRPLVAHVVAVLQQVPEVSEVWIVGNAERLGEVFDRPEIRSTLTKPLHIVPQLRHLWENCWQAYRLTLPGAPPEGRDPESEADFEHQALYLSGDLPFATPQEISAFIQRSWQADCDYALGLVTAASLEDFLPESAGAPGIEVAYFNLKEDRYRQSNLHLVKPGRLENRHYIEEMYQHRHQREIGNMLALAWRLLMSRQGGLTILFFYLLMHVAGVLDRWHWSGIADRLRAVIFMERVEATVGRLLGTGFRFITTEAGGCAIDIDTDEEYDASRECFESWTARQRERAEALYGPPALPADAGADSREEA